MRFSLLITILILSVIIVFHELGHFIWCQIFGIPTPVFSIGFGPQLIGIKIHQTVFQIAMLPFGGYVSMDAKAIAQAPYWQKMIITLAGVFNNFLLAFGAFFISHNVHHAFMQRFQHAYALFINALKQVGALFIGMRPVKSSTLLTMHQQEASFMNLLVYRIGLINIELAMFNLLPIPFLDGGHALSYTIQAITQLFGARQKLIRHLLYIIIIVLTFLIVNRMRIKRQSAANEER